MKRLLLMLVFVFSLQNGSAEEVWLASGSSPETPVATFAPATEHSVFTLDEYKELHEGKVVIKTDYRAPGVPEDIGSQIAAIAYVQAPIERVWAILSNWKSYEKIFPNVKEVRLIEKKDNSVVLYFNISLSLRNVEYYLNYFFFKDKNLVTFQLNHAKENDFKRFHGYFKFDPVVAEEGQFIQVVYSVDVELGNFLPSFIKDYFAKKDLPKVMENLKKWIELKKEKL